MFLAALGEFSLALDGARGDEGPRLAAALERMDQALSAWDTMIRGYEDSMRAEIQGADPALAARMRTALGLVYADRGRFEDAVEQFTAARSLDSSNAGTALLQGLVYAQALDEPAAAIEAFRAAASIDPTDPGAAYLLARYLRDSGFEAEAGEALATFLRLIDAMPLASGSGAQPFIRLGLVPEAPGVEPFLPPVRYAEGFVALRRGDLHAAVDAFREALSADPLAATAIAPAYARAAAAFREGRVDAAREALAATITESPADAEAHRLLGLLEMADGRYPEAVAALETGVTLSPAEERTRLALADALARNGQLGAAVAALKETLTVMPDSGRTWYALGLLHREAGEYLATVGAFEEAVSRGPLIARNSIYQTIGAVRQAQLDVEGAIDAYASRAALTPNDARAHQDLGEAHLLLGGNDWARAELRIALVLEPARAGALKSLAQVYLREGRHEEAAAAALKALELDPGDREAHYARATALVRLGRSPEAEPHLQTYQRLLTEDAESRARGLELGRLRREAAVATAAGNHAAAAALLGRALALDPESPGSHLELGRALLEAGRSGEAIERLSAAADRGAPLEVHLLLARAYDAAGQAEQSRRARERHASLKRDAIRRGGDTR